MTATSPIGVHRVLDPTGAELTLPQAARRLDDSPEVGPDEVRIHVEVLNLDAASYRQLADTHRLPGGGTDGDAVREAVLGIVAERGKMQNPVTGSGGMLIGTVAEVGPQSPLELAVGDRVATLVSLSLTPLRITDGLARWDGLGERVPAQGHAILFGRSIAARLPEDLDPELALMVMDVCGAPALVDRVVREHSGTAGDGGKGGNSGDGGVAGGGGPTVLVLGGAGKSGSLALAAAARAGAGRRLAVVPTGREARLLAEAGGDDPLAEQVLVVDARAPLALEEAVREAGGPADVTVVCVDVPGCEQPAVLATAQGGTIVFFSMATSFAAAALGAEGVAADVRMLIGNGYVPGHADYALDLLRTTPAVRVLFEGRLGETGSP